MLVTIGVLLSTVSSKCLIYLTIRNFWDEIIPVITT
jgi:hypothetical protein